MECGEGRHLPLLAFSWLVLIGVGIGFPLALFSLLVQRRYVQEFTLIKSRALSLAANHASCKLLGWQQTRAGEALINKIRV